MTRIQNALVCPGLLQLLNNDGFKICSSARMKIPFGLGLDVPRVLYIDTDAVVIW